MRKIVLLLILLFCLSGCGFAKNLYRAGSGLAKNVYYKLSADTLVMNASETKEAIAGENFDWRDANGNNLLHQAAFWNMPDAVKTIISSGKINVDEPNNYGETPLHVAAYCGNGKVVDTLLAAKGNPLYKAQNRQTPLDFALKQGHIGLGLKIAEACPSMPMDIIMSRMTIAVKQGHLDYIEKYLKAGIRPDSKVIDAAIADGQNAILREFIKSNVKLPVAELSEMMALYIQTGDIETTKRLLASGSSVNAKDKSGKTPLHYAVMLDRVDIVELLLSKGANPNLEDNAGKNVYYYVQSGSKGYYPELYRKLNSFDGYEIAYRITKSKHDFNNMQRYARTKEQKERLEAYVLQLIKDKGKLFNVTVNAVPGRKYDEKQSGLFVLEKNWTYKDYNLNYTIRKALKPAIPLKYGPYNVVVELALQYDRACARRSQVLSSYNEEDVVVKTSYPTVLMSRDRKISKDSSLLTATLSYVDKGAAGGTTQCVMVGDPVAKAKVDSIYPADEKLRESIAPIKVPERKALNKEQRPISYDYVRYAMGGNAKDSGTIKRDGKLHGNIGIGWLGHIGGRSAYHDSGHQRLVEFDFGSILRDPKGEESYQYTIAMWVKLDKEFEDEMNDDNALTIGKALKYGSIKVDAGSMVHDTGSNSETISSSENSRPGDWNFVAYICKGHNVYMYRNGKIVTHKFFKKIPYIESNKAYIGGKYLKYRHDYYCSKLNVGDVSLYARALSKNELDAMYHDL